MGCRKFSKKSGKTPLNMLSRVALRSGKTNNAFLTIVFNIITTQPWSQGGLCNRKFDSSRMNISFFFLNLVYFLFYSKRNKNVKAS